MSSSGGMWQRIVPGLGLAQRRFLGFADPADLARAAALKHAARRRLERAPGSRPEVGCAYLGCRRCQEPPRAALPYRDVAVRETLALLDRSRRCGRDRARDPVGQIADDAEIMRDENAAHGLRHLEIGQQIEDRCLHRHIERRGRFIAHHHLGLAGKGPRNCHPLLEPAGQRPLLRQIAIGQLHAVRQSEQPLLQRRATEPPGAWRSPGRSAGAPHATG